MSFFLQKGLTTTWHGGGDETFNKTASQLAFAVQLKPWELEREPSERIGLTGMQFFTAHEHWEIIWLSSKEPERTFLRFKSSLRFITSSVVIPGALVPCCTGRECGAFSGILPGL